MAEKTPIKIIPHPTEAGKYQINEFETGDTVAAAFLPSSSIAGDMLRSVYDPDFDGKVETAVTADSALSINDGYF